MKMPRSAILGVFILSLAMSARAPAATWTVCGSLCSGQTIAAALAAAVTDTVAIIDLQTNTTEAVSLGQPISEMMSSTGAVWLATGGAPNLSITAGATGHMRFHDITLQHTGTQGDCIVWVAIGAGATVFLDQGLIIDQNTDANGFRMVVATTASNQLRINRIIADGHLSGATANRGIFLQGGVNNGCFVTNSLLERWGRSAINNSVDNGAGSFAISAGNNTVYNCGTITATSAALRMGGNFRAVNNLVLGGNASQADVSFSGSAVCGMESNSLHGATTPTPCGTPAVILGVSPTNVFPDPGNDFRLLPGSQASNTGVTVTWIPTADLYGTPRPQGAAWDMGAVENIVTATFTVTPTFTSTPTSTSTATPTTTPTPSATPTFTATPSFTGTSTATATWSNTSTATPTFTQTSTSTPTRTVTPTRSSTRTITVTSTTSPTPTATRTAVCGPYGDQVAESFKAYGFPMWSGNRYALPAGRVNYFEIYLNAPGDNIQMALYSDSSNRPAALVCKSGVQAAVVGWNLLTASAQTFSAGNYWILFQANSGPALATRVWGRPGETMFIQRCSVSQGCQFVAPPSTLSGIIYPNKYTFAAYAQVCDF